jgi:hypothetical protein
MTHSTYVQTISGGAGGFFASCMRCGCDPFPNRETFDQAKADAQAHGDFQPGLIGLQPSSATGMAVGTMIL